MKRSTVVFVIFAILWEIAVGLIYGFYFSYNEAAFTTMNQITSYYAYSNTSQSTNLFQVNSTKYPYPMAVVSIAIIMLIIGYALIAAYISRSSLSGITFTLLIFALTTQNLIIFKCFWDRIGLNNPNGHTNFTSNYSKINYVNYMNDLQNTLSTYNINSASIIDAVGASIAMYCGYTALIGRIGLGQVFLLTWIGTFLYQMNSQLLWRLYIPDNGYPSRAYAFGGVLGLVCSLVLGQRQKTVNHRGYMSQYKSMGIALLGAILLWCSYPIIVTSSIFNQNNGNIVVMPGQVNTWLALAAGIIGCYCASAFKFRKFSVHDVVFVSVSGAIAFSSSTDVNYNPGSATTIGAAVGFICCLGMMSRRKINESGVVQSNSVIFQFILPSLCAAIASAVLQAVGQDVVSVKANYAPFATIPFRKNREATRTAVIQGAYQMAGWGICVGVGICAGIILGLIFKCLDDRLPEDSFNDSVNFKVKEYQLSSKRII